MVSKMRRARDRQSVLFRAERTTFLCLSDFRFCDVTRLTDRLLAVIVILACCVTAALRAVCDFTSRDVQASTASLPNSIVFQSVCLEIDFHRLNRLLSDRVAFCKQELHRVSVFFAQSSENKLVGRKSCLYVWHLFR